MKTKIIWIVPAILLINIITYELTIEKSISDSLHSENRNLKYCVKSVITNTSNHVRSTNSKMELSQKDTHNKYENLLGDYKDFKDYLLNLGYSQKYIDSIKYLADNIIKNGQITYTGMFVLLNYESEKDYHFYQGYREGINSLNPDSIKNKIVTRIVLDSFDTKNTSQYFNAHKSFLFKSYNEAIAIGLFKDDYCNYIFWNELNYILYNVEEYYYDVGLRLRKEKILRDESDFINISMDDPKKGN